MLIGSSQLWKLTTSFLLIVTKATNIFATNNLTKMSVITMAHCELVVDALYHNAERKKFEQKGMRQIAKDCDVSVPVVQKVKNILVDMKLLIIEGNRRTQECIWHPDKSKPNPAMLREVYKTYIKGAGSKVMVKQKRFAPTSLDSALQALVKLGYTGVISKVKHDGYRTITESIDLSKIELGE